jgi:hypothetical protein
VQQCKQRNVIFDTFSVQVISIKLSVPSSPDSQSVRGQKFITRMKDTDFFQVLSMYIPPSKHVKLMIIGLKLLFHLLQKKKKKRKRPILRNIFPSNMMNKLKVFGLQVMLPYNLQKNTILKNIFKS